MRVIAPAKVNLTLEILGKRHDGFHEICSVLRTLALHDTLDVEPGPIVEVLCDTPGLAGPGNLAHKAAELLQQTCGIRQGARIAIHKVIPVAAGLGGGSSDAAATLTALNELWGAGLDGEALTRLAAQVGSDVPFFVHGGTALASGRGEVLRPLADQPDCHVVLVNPGVAVSTATVYQNVTPDMYADGSRGARFAALAPATAIRDWPLANTLQAVTNALYPVVDDVLASLRDWGASQTLMCGSGPTCFGLFEDARQGRDAVAAAKEAEWQAWLTHFA